jgi:hypothetical protein
MNKYQVYANRIKRPHERSEFMTLFMEAACIGAAIFLMWAFCVIVFSL